MPLSLTFVKHWLPKASVFCLARQLLLFGSLYCAWNTIMHLKYSSHALGFSNICISLSEGRGISSLQEHPAWRLGWLGSGRAWGCVKSWRCDAGRDHSVNNLRGHGEEFPWSRARANEEHHTFTSKSQEARNLENVLYLTSFNWNPSK